MNALLTTNSLTIFSMSFAADFLMCLPDLLKTEKLESKTFIRTVVTPRE